MIGTNIVQRITLYKFYTYVIIILIYAVLKKNSILNSCPQNQCSAKIVYYYSIVLNFKCIYVSLNYLSNNENVKLK